MEPHKARSRHAAEQREAAAHVDSSIGQKVDLAERAAHGRHGVRAESGIERAVDVDTDQPRGACIEAVSYQHLAVRLHGDRGHVAGEGRIEAAV